jgi:hypothetical protein
MANGMPQGIAADVNTLDATVGHQTRCEAPYTGDSFSDVTPTRNVKPPLGGGRSSGAGDGNRSGANADCKRAQETFFRFPDGSVAQTGLRGFIL